MVSASDIAKRALVSVLRNSFSLYSVAIGICRDSPDYQPQMLTHFLIVASVNPRYLFFRPKGRRNHAAVLQPNIWLKVLPKSLHQFRKRFQIECFRRLTLLSGRWFPCCEICFRSTRASRWLLASPGTLQITHLRCLRTFLSWLQWTHTMSFFVGRRGAEITHHCYESSLKKHMWRKYMSPPSPPRLLRLFSLWRDGTIPLVKLFKY